MYLIKSSITIGYNQHQIAWHSNEGDKFINGSVGNFCHDVFIILDETGTQDVSIANGYHVLQSGSLDAQVNSHDVPPAVAKATHQGKKFIEIRRAAKVGSWLWNYQ